MKERPPEDPRVFAVSILREWEKGGKFIRDLLEKAVRENSFSPKERGFLVNTLYGVVRRKGTLDWLIDHFSRKKKPDRAGLVRQVLRLSIFHLLYLDAIPPYAVLHQAGEMGRLRLSDREKSYINAVLRGIDSRSGNLPFPPPEREVEYLNIVHSHPAWLVSRWLERWDFSVVEELCRTDNLPPPIFIRANRLRGGPERLEESLREAGVSSQPYGEREGVRAIKPSGPISSLAPFSAGYFQVQDPSTLEAVDLLDPGEGETVADLCAAPGGKASYLAEKMRNTGVLFVGDVSRKRLKLLEDNFRRLGVRNAVVGEFDLRKEQALPDGLTADRILLDVPCSNTGVLRRRVDARWRIMAGEITSLAEQAFRLLDNASKLLKPGGRLVYSTCSLEEEENQEVVKKFIGRNKEYRLLEEREGKPETEGRDGFYAALLVRKKQ